ncbi:MAG: hypothetical protein U9O24_06280, partial [Campylobacterota bacterium]|nr:hypothetical protein [Campylobacterota bacterium]
PELTTRTDHSLKSFLGGSSTKSYDIYEEVDLNGTTLHHNEPTTIEEWLDSKKPSAGLMYDSSDVYKEFLPLWEGPDKIAEDEAIARLVDILSIKLLGKELPAFYKQKIVSQVDRRGNPIFMVRQVTRNIVNSSHFMILD